MKSSVFRVVGIYLAMASDGHRPGPWKQSNKSHNTGRHRSKGSVEKDNRGRVGVKVSGVYKVKKSLGGEGNHFMTFWKAL